MTWRERMATFGYLGLMACTNTAAIALTDHHWFALAINAIGAGAYVYGLYDMAD